MNHQLANLDFRDMVAVSGDRVITTSRKVAAIRNDLGSDHYVMVDVIGAKDKRGATTKKAQELIDYVEQNDIADECLGLIQNLGNLPAPVLTEEGRLVFRLQFMCVYGE